MASADLADLLAKVLPTGVEITVRHVSSIPTPCEALFAAAPGQISEPTFCENHFLSGSIDPRDEGEVIIFGMEVMVYNTAHLTTIFVSKADSTGFLHLLKVPRKVSVIRLISSTFLSFLAQTRQRPGVRLVVSLFARAQNQYLFPGSIENAEKHVLDDRGLIKWWCRALDPILREHEPESALQEAKPLDQRVEAAKASSTAYLIVPSCDRFETRNFFPVTAKQDPQDHPRWLNTYPLKQLYHDPSTRFLVDLDDELPEEKEGEPVPSNAGRWRSVRTLDQFWEMMSFRQECSAGRLVGFLWLVINPPGLMNSTSMESQTRGSLVNNQVSSGAEISGAVADEEKNLIDPSKSETSDNLTQATTTAIYTAPDKTLKLPLDDASSAVNPFDWPEAGRGQVVFSEADYKKMMNSVLDHFYDEKEVVASTTSYIDIVSSLGDELTWGKKVVGKNATSSDAVQPVDTKANNVLDLGLIRKRKKSVGVDNAPAQNNLQGPSGSGNTQPAAETVGVNVLNPSLVRKKKKT
ncbi:hypothetical protein N7475_001418 [Penicillium sp. IBT 31633x]|nr:hypothetical protein N7475_001418 [Penicillium sp. IBT 31633x]